MRETKILREKIARLFGSLERYGAVSAARFECYLFNFGSLSRRSYETRSESVYLSFRATKRKVISPPIVDVARYVLGLHDGLHRERCYEIVGYFIARVTSRRFSTKSQLAPPSPPPPPETDRRSVDRSKWDGERGTIKVKLYNGFESGVTRSRALRGSLKSVTTLTMGISASR